MTTQRIRFGPMVSPITFYHPATLVKMAVALDTLSGGRLDLGIGAGWNEYEHTAFGVPMPGVRERVDRLECAARYIRALGAGRPVTLEQRYYPLVKAEVHPLPSHGRLRLVIGPVNSLYWEKNYNAGGEVAAESMKDARAVTVTLYHDRGHPSALFVPLGRPLAADEPSAPAAAFSER